jgi:hypothetical protein
VFLRRDEDNPVDAGCLQDREIADGKLPERRLNAPEFAGEDRLEVFSAAHEGRTVQGHVLNLEFQLAATRHDDGFGGLAEEAQVIDEDSSGEAAWV